MADDQQPNAIPSNVAAPTTPVPLDDNTGTPLATTAAPSTPDSSKLGPVAANPSTQDAQQSGQTADPNAPKVTPDDARAKFPYPGGDDQDTSTPVQKAPPPNPNAPSYVATGTPNLTHPLVQKAGVTNSIALALMGGARYKTTIDPTTGVTSREQIPVSRKDVGLAIAMEAISGSLVGLAQSGPNATAKAAVAGMQQGEKIAQGTKDANQQADQQANADYARQAAITQTNFQTHQNQLKLSVMDHDYQQQHVADQAPVLDNLNKVGAVLGQHVNAADLFPRYHVTQQNAIPDGVIRSVNPDGSYAKNADGSDKWENTFSVIDPKATIELPDATKQYLADHMVSGFYKLVDGKPVPQDLPADTPMRASYVVGGMAQAASLQLTEDSIGRQLQGTGKEGESAADQFKGSLKKAIASGALSQDGMKVLSQYANLPLDKIADTMAHDKVNPSIIAQVRAILPPDAVEKMKNDRVAAETKNKALAVIDSAPKANAILADPKSTPEQIASAKSFINNTQNQDVSKQAALVRIKAMTAGAEESAKLSAQDRHQAALDEKAIGDAAQYASDPVVNGIRQNYLSALPPQMGNLVKAIGEYGQKPDILERGKEGKQLAQMVNTAYPGYNGKLYPLVQKTMEAFTGEGKEAQQVKSFNTFMDHLGGALEASNQYRRSGLGTKLNQPLSWWKKNYSGDPVYSQLETAIEPVKTEFMTFLGNNHALTEHDKKTGDVMASTDMSPAVLEANFKKFAETAAFRAAESNEGYHRVTGQNFPGYVSSRALDTIKGLTDASGNNKVADTIGHMDTGGTFMGAAHGRGQLGMTVNEALGRKTSAPSSGSSGASANAWKPPAGAPSAQGQPDGHYLYQNGKPVAVVKGGQWNQLTAQPQ